MAVETVVKTIGTTGVFSTVQLWEDGAPANLTTAERSACGTFAVSTFVQGEALTFVGSGATGVMLDTDSTGPGTGTYMTYGISTGNPGTGDVITGTSTATCILTSGTPDFTGIIWQGQCQNQTFTVAGTVLTVAGSTNSTTAYKELTTGTGASFADHANKRNNALRYNTANGAALDGTANTGLTVFLNETGTVRFNKLQVTGSNTGGRAISIGGATSLVKDCIFDGRYAAISSTNGILNIGNNGTVSNCVVVQRASAADHIISTTTASPTFRNCTIVASDDHATAPTSVWSTGASGTVTVQNCGMFAGDSTKAIAQGAAVINFTTCFSDISGTAGVTQTTYPNEFESVLDATLDFKLISSAYQRDTGTTDAGNVPNDIIGTARPYGSGYDVGAHEYVDTVWAGVID